MKKNIFLKFPYGTTNTKNGHLQNNLPRHHAKNVDRLTSRRKAMSSYTINPSKLFNIIAKMNDHQRSTFILHETIKMMNEGKIDWGTRIRGKKETGGYTEEFENFWKAYPKKVGKGVAMKLFQEQGSPLEECLNALKWQSKSRSWKDGYIPNPETYLRQRRYEDEPEEIPENKKGYVDMNGMWREGQ